jgi:hypothetical protein
VCVITGDKQKNLRKVVFAAKVTFCGKSDFFTRKSHLSTESDDARMNHTN